MCLMNQKENSVDPIRQLKTTNQTRTCQRGLCMQRSIDDHLLSSPWVSLIVWPWWVEQ